MTARLHVVRSFCGSRAAGADELEWTAPVRRHWVTRQKPLKHTVAVRQRLRDRLPAAIAAALVGLVALCLGLYWWLAPVVSPRQANCGSVKDPSERVEATEIYASDRSPCGQAYDDQARLGRISVGTVASAGIVFGAVTVVPTRKPKALPSDWLEREDDDVLKA